MGLALDELTEDDVVDTINGITVAIEKTVLAHAGTISLDVQNGGLVMVGSASCC